MRYLLLYKPKKRFYKYFSLFETKDKKVLDCFKNQMAKFYGKMVFRVVRL